MDLLLEPVCFTVVGDIHLLETTDGVDGLADTVRVSLFVGHEGNVCWILKHRITEGLRFCKIEDL